MDIYEEELKTIIISKAVKILLDTFVFTPNFTVSTHIFAPRDKNVICSVHTGSPKV